MTMDRAELQRLYDDCRDGRYGHLVALVDGVRRFLGEPDPTVEIAYLKAALADAKAERDALYGARPVAYLVVPTGYDAMVHSDKDLWTVRVELTDYQRDRWAVRHRNSCYSYAAPPSYEPLPSSRTDEWSLALQDRQGEWIMTDHDDIKAALARVNPTGEQWCIWNGWGPLVGTENIHAATRIGTSDEDSGVHGRWTEDGDLYGSRDTLEFVASAPTWLAELLAEVDNARRELGDVHVSLYSEIAMLTARAEAAEATIQRVRGLAEAWATQPNDYDEDTEQQIEDGKAILRALDGGEQP